MSTLRLVNLLSRPGTQPRSQVGMANAPTIMLPFMLLLFSPTAMSSALAPAGAKESSSDVYVVFVSRADYIDSVDYDVRLLSSVVGRLLCDMLAFLHVHGTAVA